MFGDKARLMGMGWFGRRLTIVVALTLLLAQVFSSSNLMRVGSAAPGEQGPLVKVQQFPGVQGADRTLSQVEFQSGIRQGLSALGSELTPTFGNIGVLTTVPVSSPIPFSHLGIRWRGVLIDVLSVQIELRVSKDGVSWTEWQETEVDDDVLYSADGQVISRLTDFDARGGLYNYAQARLKLMDVSPATRPSISSLSFSFINPFDASFPVADPNATTAMPLASAQAIARPPIVSRTAWGSPDRQGSPSWPPEYKTPTAIIVHHTATTSSSGDWPAEVRAIWYYHALTNGWGDIGYNYLVDPNGVIYEGRAGGDDVIGGHALQYNPGSVGIAFLGDYTYSSPSSSARNSMTNLLSWKADHRGIDPAVSRYFVDRTLPTVMGHRDVNYTTCPGGGAYSLMNTLRAEARNRVLAVPASIQVLSTKFEPSQLPSGGLLKVTTTVKNNGSTTVQTQGPSPGYVYNEGERYGSVESEKFNRFRIGVDFAGRTQADDHPYRWGLGRDLAPGETAAVVGYVRLWNQRTTNYWGGAVREGVEWMADGLGAAAIRVSGSQLLSSVVAPLERYQAHQPFTVYWSGTNNATRYYVQYRDGPNGSWVNWLNRGATQGTSEPFSGGDGHTYYFRSLAEDAMGIRESKSADQFDTLTTVDLTPPAFSVSVPSSTTRNWWLISWSGSDATSGVAPDFRIEVSVNGGAWSQWAWARGNRALYSGATPGASYRFRLTGWDLAGNSNQATSGAIVAGSDASGLNHRYLVPVQKNAGGGW